MATIGGGGGCLIQVATSTGSTVHSGKSLVVYKCMLFSFFMYIAQLTSVVTLTTITHLTLQSHGSFSVKKIMDREIHNTQFVAVS